VPTIWVWRFEAKRCRGDKAILLPAPNRPWRTPNGFRQSPDGQTLNFQLIDEDDDLAALGVSHGTIMKRSR
jgi:hypothetical protein